MTRLQQEMNRLAETQREVDRLEEQVTRKRRDIELEREIRHNLEIQIESLLETLKWVTDRYEATLAGRPVRDADEAIGAARKILKEEWDA